MSFISIDECFSSPQQLHIRSERLRVKVKSQSRSLTVGELKKAIVRKGYPSLSDASRITLIVPLGTGILLRDEMTASDLPPDSSILALVSSTSRETVHLHANGDLNLPHILFVYYPDGFRSHVKLPHSVVIPEAGNWMSWRTSWSSTMSDLVQQFIQLGFNPALVKREFMRLEQRRLPEPLSTLPPDSVGQLAPSLLFRLWDAAGLNRLISSQKQAAMNEQTAPSEFEVFSACSSFSAESDETVGTLKDDTFYPSTSPNNVTVSDSYAARHPIPSVVMASPSDCQSVGQGSFHPSYCAPEPTVQGSDCSSESGHSETYSNMDWSYVQANHRSVIMSTSNKISQVIKKVGDLTKERDRASAKAQQSGGSDTNEMVRILKEQAVKFEEERHRLTSELVKLTSSNQALKREVEAEVQTVKELFETVDRLRDENTVNETQDAIKTLREIQENLSNVVTCSVCCEQFGSLSENMVRRPIHLSCGHIFCASCLHSDWTNRASMGIVPEARCFNRCDNFDVNRLSEIYLLDDVKDVLERLPAL